MAKTKCSSSSWRNPVFNIAAFNFLVKQLSLLFMHLYHKKGNSAHGNKSSALTLSYFYGTIPRPGCQPRLFTGVAPLLLCLGNAMLSGRLFKVKVLSVIPLILISPGPHPPALSPRPDLRGTFKKHLHLKVRERKRPQFVSLHCETLFTLRKKGLLILYRGTYFCWLVFREIAPLSMAS